jgi:hypothetical protein
MTWAMRPLTKTIFCASEPRRDALKERTRERVPVAWADTQNNLGLALGRLGERELAVRDSDDDLTLAKLRISTAVPPLHDP